MSELEALGQVALANVFVMYFKSQSYHWNVEAHNFAEMHGFFGDIYEDLYESIDTFAEELRGINVYAPVSLMELYNYKTIQEDIVKPNNAMTMVANLLKDNEEVIDCLNKLFKAATAEGKQGYANFVADRMDKHTKHGWMLRSFLKSGE